MPKKQNISNKKFQKFLIHAGCVLKRSVGDHFIYTRPDLKRPIVIPLDNPLPQFIVQNNLRVLGMSWEEFFVIFETL